MFQRIQDFPLGQHFPHSTFLTHQGPWDTTDDPHIHCLQMICAIWGEKYYITLIFFRAVVYLGCAAYWSMKSKIFLFVVPVWHSSCTINSSKVAEIIHELEFAVYLVWSVFYISEAVGGCYTCQSPMPSALQSGRTVTVCFDFVPPWQESPYWAGDYSRVQFHQH